MTVQREYALFDNPDQLDMFETVTEKARREYDALQVRTNIELEALWEIVITTCEHPTKYRIKTMEYHPGGYDYVAETATTTICSLCNTELDTVVKKSNRY